MRAPFTRAPLPIDGALSQVVTALSGGSSLVLRADTGAGKTTRVPPALFDAGFAERGQIVLLEPRRVAARAATRRIAAERGWDVGRQVGYAIRHDRCVSHATRIVVVTEGVLLRMLQGDPFLSAVSVVMFDEFHERRLESDLALAMTRKVQREVRPDLKLVVMSATIDTTAIVDFLSPATTVDCPGRQYPVRCGYLASPDDRPPAELAVTGIGRALDQTDADVLAFLPGVLEIHRAQAELSRRGWDRDLAVLQLFGDLPPTQQDAVLAPASRRKVVLATNVAETSITIEGIGAVVDTGFAKVPLFDVGCGLTRLELVRISRASAEQRASRAGRLGPGVAFRMWTRAQHDALRAHHLAEVERADLSRAVLELLAWGERDIEAFGWLQPPPSDAIDRALSQLRRLGAVDASGLTEVGRWMARLPLQPRLARLVVEANRLGHLADGATMAALLGERDPLGAELHAESHTSSRSDVLVRLDSWRHGRRRAHIGDSLERTAVQIRSLGRRVLPAPSEPCDGGDEALLRSLFAAYRDRLARRRADGSPRALMVGGRGVRLAPTSTVLADPLFVCVELSAGSRSERAEAVVRQASAVELDWIAADDLREETTLCFDPQMKRVTAARTLRFFDLVLSRHPAPNVLRIPAATLRSPCSPE